MSTTRQSRALTIGQQWFAWGVFLVAAFLFFWVAEHFVGEPRQSLDWHEYILVAWSIYALTSARYVRSALPKNARKRVSANPKSPEELWSVIQLMKLAAAENLVVCYVVGRWVFDSPKWFCYSLFAVGVLFLLYFYPRPIPEDLIASSRPES